MKGQYRIVLEVLLFLMGLMVASFTIITFTGLESGTRDIVIEDGMSSVANVVMNGVVEAANSGKSVVRVDIPVLVADLPYVMEMESNTLTVSALDMPSVKVTREIFNMDRKYNIIGKSVSSSGVAEIVSDGTNLVLRRAKG